MKKWVNGQIVEMTNEEIAEFEQSITEAPPTETERLDAIEAAIMELAEVILNG